MFPTFYLSWIEGLGLYHALEDDGRECLIDKHGNVVRELLRYGSSETCWTHFPTGILDKWEMDFYRQSNYWVETRGSEQTFICSVFSFREGQVVRLLGHEHILNAAPITPRKLLLQIAADKDKPCGLMKIGLYDVIDDQCKVLLEAPYAELPFSVHRVWGASHLFSVLMKEVEVEEPRYRRELFRLYNPEGEPLVSFDTTIGQHGENTCFDPSRRGLGITYKALDEPIGLSSGFYGESCDTCAVLIDQQGNCHGDFYHVAGKLPAFFGKSCTIYPRQVERKFLCLSLPDKSGQPPCLTIVNEDGSHVVTEFECPWLIFNLSATLIKDKAIFGKTCLVVIDREMNVRLVGLDGKEVENTTPIAFRSLREPYAKQFVSRRRLQAQ
ncbi:MAG: hypothetical protein QM599_11625 [Pseudoxanthomonas sp.]